MGLGTIMMKFLSKPLQEIGALLLVMCFRISLLLEMGRGSSNTH